MPRTAVVTDSVTEMTCELANEFNVKLLPMTITLSDKSHPETEIDLDWYYQQMPQWKASRKMPLTSSIPIGVFLEAFRELSLQADGILYIGHSTKFGMSVSAAEQATRMAEQELPGIIFEVIDSHTVCGAQMLIVIEAARAAAAGKSLSEVARIASDLVGKISYVVLIDDLSLLAKGGRIHRARSWADATVTNTALLGVSHASGGQMTPLARCKTRPQAVKKLFDMMTERSGDQKLHVAINYTTSLAEAQELRDLVSREFQCSEVFLTPLYPLVANHVGLEPIHLSWWGED